MKKYIALLLMILISIFSLAACGGNKDVEPEVSDDVSEEETYLTEEQEKILLDEDEGGEFKTVETEESKFYGTWVGDTERAQFIYGNIEITINKDGTWTGNITDEDITGTWTRNGDGLRLTSDIMPFNFVYSGNGNFVIQEDDDAVRVVMTRK